MHSARDPTAAHIALAHELAILAVLDAALHMAVRTLEAAHPEIDPLADLLPPVHLDDDTQLARLIAAQADELRHAIDMYCRLTRGEDD
jgi:hypothetical protein